MKHSQDGGLTAHPGLLHRASIFVQHKSVFLHRLVTANENAEVLFHSVSMTAKSYWRILGMLRDHTHIFKYLKGGYNEDWSQAFASSAQCKPRGTWQNLDPRATPAHQAALLSWEVLGPEGCWGLLLGHLQTWMWCWAAEPRGAPTSTML